MEEKSSASGSQDVGVVAAATDQSEHAKPKFPHVHNVARRDGPGPPQLCVAPAAPGTSSMPTAMSRSLTITYDLHPPVGSSVDTSLDPKATHNFDLSVSASEGTHEPGYKAHYEALRAAIGEARATTGDELTRWRDAVGTAEQTKENTSGAKKGNEEEEDAEEGDEEGEA